MKDIPKDYDGVMGVPITFLDKYNPDQFEIVQFRKGEDGKDLAFTVEKEREWCRTSECSYEEFEKKFPLRCQVSGNERATVGGKLKYSRLFFRRRKPAGENDRDLAFTVEKEREFNRIKGFSSEESRPYEEPIDKAYPLKLQFTKDKCKVNGKETYARIFIRRKHVSENGKTPAEDLKKVVPYFRVLIRRLDKVMEP